MSNSHGPRDQPVPGAVLLYPWPGSFSEDVCVNTAWLSFADVRPEVEGHAVAAERKPQFALITQFLNGRSKRPNQQVFGQNAFACMCICATMLAIADNGTVISPQKNRGQVMQAHFDPQLKVEQFPGAQASPLSLAQAVARGHRRPD